MYYFWIKAVFEGRTIVLGPYRSEEEATEKGIDKLPASCQFDIVQLPTKDEAKATRMLKAGILRETSDLSGSLKRVKHDKKNKIVGDLNKLKDKIRNYGKED